MKKPNRVCDIQLGQMKADEARGEVASVINGFSKKLSEFALFRSSPVEHM